MSQVRLEDSGECPVVAESGTDAQLATRSSNYLSRHTCPSSQALLENRSVAYSMSFTLGIRNALRYLPLSHGCRAAGKHKSAGHNSRLGQIGNRGSPWTNEIVLARLRGIPEWPEGWVRKC